MGSTTAPPRTLRKKLARLRRCGKLVASSSGRSDATTTRRSMSHRQAAAFAASRRKVGVRPAIRPAAAHRAMTREGRAIVANGTWSDRSQPRSGPRHRRRGGERGALRRDGERGQRARRAARSWRPPDLTGRLRSRVGLLRPSRWAAGARSTALTRHAHVEATATTRSLQPTAGTSQKLPQPTPARRPRCWRKREADVGGRRNAAMRRRLGVSVGQQAGAIETAPPSRPREADDHRARPADQREADGRQAARPCQRWTEDEQVNGSAWRRRRQARAGVVGSRRKARHGIGGEPPRRQGQHDARAGARPAKVCQIQRRAGKDDLIDQRRGPGLRSRHEENRQSVEFDATAGVNASTIIVRPASH